MATLGDLSWYRGDSYPISLTVTDKSLGTPIDLTNYLFFMTANTVKEPTGIDQQLFQVDGVVDPDPTLGKVSFTPTTTQTSIDPGKYFYDIQMVDSEGHVRTIAKYKLSILQDITKNVVSATEYSISFTDSDLESFILAVEHNLGEPYPVIAVYDNNNEIVEPTITSIDSDNFTLDFGAAIEGTYFVTVRVLGDRHSESFTNTDLDMFNVLTVDHALNDPHPIVAVYDYTGELVRTVTVTSVDFNTFTVDMGQIISGTWYLTAM